MHYVIQQPLSGGTRKEFMRPCGMQVLLRVERHIGEKKRLGALQVRLSSTKVRGQKAGGINLRKYFGQRVRGTTPNDASPSTMICL